MASTLCFELVNGTPIYGFIIEIVREQQRIGNFFTFLISYDEFKILKKIYVNITYKSNGVDCKLLITISVGNALDGSNTTIAFNDINSLVSFRFSFRCKGVKVVVDLEKCWRRK